MAAFAAAVSLSATPLAAAEIEVRGHSTSPPARYTEASLVKRLEELGIGRPSTYASIISTIQDRGYVWKKGTALVPSWTAFAVIQLLEQHFFKNKFFGRKNKIRGFHRDTEIQKHLFNFSCFFIYRAARGGGISF